MKTGVCFLLFREVEVSEFTEKMFSVDEFLLSTLSLKRDLNRLQLEAVAAVDHFGGQP